MAKIDCPCLGCDKRYPCCHGSCDDYKKYQKTRQEKADAIKASKSREKIYTDYHTGAVTKVKKKFNLK